MTEINRKITLAARPVGFPKPTDFRLVEEPIPAVGPGQMLVRVRYLSVDPYMRGRMNDAPSYAPPVGLGEVMVGGAVGAVVESQHPEYPPGQIVTGNFGWQAFAVADGRDVMRVDPAIAPISTSLGVLGMPGLTAYFGLLDVGRPRPGETVVVSGAAGAVGSAVGQIARLNGCRVVGVAGSEEKVRHVVEELGFDAAFNYKTTQNYVAKLRELCPDGVDVYFDNVGGPLTDAVFLTMNLRARVAICGQISLYNAERPEMGPRLLGLLIQRRARVEGFLIFDFRDRYAEGLRQLSRWVRDGKLKYRETIVDGLENAPAAFMGLLRGENLGKQLVRVSAE